MADRYNKKFTAARRKKFLEYIREQYSITAAARAVGVTRQAVYTHKNQDPGFAEAMQEAIDDHLDELERSLLARGKTGESDTAAIFMLKSMRPEIYREHGTIEHTGNVNHSHEHRAVQETNSFIEGVLSDGEDRPLPKPGTH